MIYPSCCCFPKYSGNKEQGIKSSQDLAEWCNMFKYVNCVRGSPHDWRKPIKRNWTLPLLAMKQGSCSAFWCARSGHQCPWDIPGCCIVLLSPFLMKVALRQRPWQLMALEPPSSPGWLSGWFMLLHGSLLLVRALEAEVIYLCVEPSCTQQRSVWPRERKHPGPPAWDPEVLGILVTFWHGRVPRGTGHRPLTLLLSTRDSLAQLGGCLLVVPQDGWLTQPRATAVLPAAKVPYRVAAEMLEFSM